MNAVRDIRPATRRAVSRVKTSAREVGIAAASHPALVAGTALVGAGVSHVLNTLEDSFGFDPYDWSDSEDRFYGPEPELDSSE